MLNGIQVGARHYVRLFPVWFEFRGNHGTVLTQAKAISAAAHLRGSRALATLAQQQLQWVMGRNPFAQSTMWGEGYDYAPQYSAMSADIVGSLPVGIQTRGNTDLPYWPAENCHNWKEVWVHPVARWLWLMRDLAGPASVSGLVSGDFSGPVVFRELDSGALTYLDPDPAGGTFRSLLLEGEYEVSGSGFKRTVTLLPGGTYTLDFRPGRRLHVRVAAQTAPGGSVSLKATLEGEGRHRVVVRADNLVISQPERHLDLKPGTPQTLVWEAKLASPDTPWVAVFIPDDDLSQRLELTGSPRTLKSPW